MPVSHPPASLDVEKPIRGGDDLDRQNTEILQRDFGYVEPEVLSSDGLQQPDQDLELAIGHRRRVLELSSAANARQALALNILANNIVAHTKQDSEEDVDQIETAIYVLQTMLRLQSLDNQRLCTTLSTLGNTFLTRFQRLGGLGDLNEAVLMCQNAVRLRADGHCDPLWLINLSNSLWTRFQRLGSLNDLNTSVQVCYDALRLTPDGHINKPLWMNSLGNLLLTRSRRLNSLSDLNQSVLMYQEALLVTPTERFFLNGLGSSLLTRFQRLGSLSDLNDSVQMYQDVVQLTSDIHPNKSVWLDRLGSALLTRFQHLSTLNDLTKSVLSHQDAVQLIPDGHPDRSLLLTNLGHSLVARFKHHNNFEDRVQALRHYRSAALAVGPPFDRFQAASHWSLLADEMQHPSILHGYSTAIHLLPQLAWLGSSVTDRHFWIQNAIEVVRPAIMAAIKADKHTVSVKWLEQGRSIIWRQILQLRTPLDALKAAYPEMGLQLETLSSQLEGAAMSQQSSSRSDVDTHQLVSQEAKDYHHLTDERDQLIKKIQSYPGFERFLLPKPFSDLAQAATKACGPVIMLTAGVNGCDALVLTPSQYNPIHVPLPDMSKTKAMGLKKTLNTYVHAHLRLGIEQVVPENHQSAREEMERQLCDVLYSLWKDIIEPIVKELHLNSDKLTRLWWCPTGILSFLPLHAAGNYSPNAPPDSKLTDYAISSYTPSITALLKALDSRPKDQYHPNVLVVVQPTASGQTRLPGTEEELRLIRNQTKDLIPLTTLKNSEASIDKVKEGMITATSVHFACHGVQKAGSPTESALLVAPDSRLTLSEIVGMKLEAKDLAFLSACQTATGDEKLPDEAVHLAAGMLLAGYRGVIATMWSIHDKYAPRVANDVYGHLFLNSQMDVTRAAEALHLAVKNLRESGAPYSSWLPFIHLGA